eukprot:3300102-Alexandrium_andersonii.AAC.1
MSRLSRRAVAFGNAGARFSARQACSGRCCPGLGREAAGADPRARAPRRGASHPGFRLPAVEWHAA